MKNIHKPHNRLIAALLVLVCLLGLLTRHSDEHKAERRSPIIFGNTDTQTAAARINHGFKVASPAGAGLSAWASAHDGYGRYSGYDQDGRLRLQWSQV